MKKNKKILISALLLLVMLCIIGTASAEDVTNENLATDDGDVLSVDEPLSGPADDSLASSADNEKLSEKTITVDKNGNGDYDSIFAAVDAAESGDKIFIKNGNYTDKLIQFSTDSHSAIKKLTLEGESKEGVIISSETSYFIFSSSELNLTISNIQFKDIKCGGTNSPIKNTGKMDLLISNCIFNNCKSQYSAMNIGGTQSTAIIENTEFIDCGEVSKNNGALALVFTGSSMQINNCLVDTTSFTGLTSGQANAVIYNNGKGKMTISGTTIKNCAGYANSIVRNNGGTLEIINSRIIDNSIEARSDSVDCVIIMNNQGTLKVTNTVFSNNTVKNFVSSKSGTSGTAYTTMNYCNIQNNTLSGNFTVSGSDLTKMDVAKNYWGTNDEPAVSGAAPYVVYENGAYKLSDDSETDIAIPSLTQQSGEPDDSDAIFVSPSGNDTNDGSEASPVATIAKAVELANNGAGKVIIEEGTYVENNIQLDNSKPISITGRGKVVIDGNASSNSIFVMDGGSANFTNILFTNNSPKYGGAIKAGSNVEIFILVDNCTFADINSTSRGGAIYGVTVTGKLTVKDSKFSNIDSGSWGAITIATSSFTGGLEVDISGSTFEYNKANNGAALYLRVDKVTIKDSVFVNNSAGNAPGAIYLYNATGLIDNCIICNNTAGDKGVAIVSTPVSKSVTTLTITNSIIENNNGKDQVYPAVYADMNMIEISYCSLENQLSLETRTATGYDAVYGQGVIIANNNWWGTNDPKSKVTGKNITIDKWVIMNVDANASEVLIGDEVKLTIDFSHVNTTSGEIEELTGGVIPKSFEVTLTTTSGSIEPAAVEIGKGTSKDVIYTVADVDAVVSVQTGDVVKTLSFAKGVEPYYGIIYVSKDGDDKNNGSESAHVATIGKAIELASIKGGSGQIIVNEGTYTGANYTVTKNLTITGVGKVVIDGQNNGFLFKVDSASNVDKFELINLTLTGAKAYHGAVVYNNAKELILDTVTITNNADTGSIIINRGDLTVKNSVISNQNSGDIIKTSGSHDVIINKTIFENNEVTADNSYFGIVYIESGKGNIYVENTKFTNNTARQGMVVSSQLGASPNIYIKNSTFTKNINQVSYGMVSAYAKLEVSDSLFENNYAKRGAGAIYVGTQGDATITKSSFINNAVESGNEGSAIYNNNKLTVNYCVLLTNTTGSIIYHDGGENVADAQYNWWGTNANPKNLVEVGEYEDDWDDYVDCEINTSNWVIMNVTSDATSEMLNIGDNVHITVDFTNYMDSSSTPQKLAEALPEFTFDANAVNGNLDNVKVKATNGVAQITYTAVTGGEDNVTVKSGNEVKVIQLNVTKPYDGEIYVSKSGNDTNDGSEGSPVATIKKAVELAQETSGKIIIKEGVYNEDSIEITKDLVISAEGAVTIDGNNSGKRLFWIKSGDVKISDLTFTNFNQAYSGSVIRMNEASSLSIDNSVFVNNGKDNRESLITATKSTLTLTNTVFKDNLAHETSTNKGPVYINGGKLYVDNCNFTNNRKQYGVFYISSAEAEIYNSTFENNLAATASYGNGGAIYVGGTSTYISSYSGKLMNGSGATLLVKNCNFINNTVKGGSLYGGSGGAIYVNNNATAIIEDSLFENNTALSGGEKGRGGAIFASAGNIKITNSVFKNNAAELGSEIYLKFYNSSMLNPEALNKLEISNSIINDANAQAIFADNEKYNATVDKNWWGTNNPLDKVNENVTLNNWVVLSAEFTPRDVEAGSAVTITASFDKVKSVNGESAFTGTLPEEIDVTFTSTSGKLNEVKTTENGNAVVTYTVDAKDKQIIVTSGDANVVLRIANEVEPVIYVDPENGNDDNNGSRATPVKTIEAALLLADNGQIVLLEGVHKTGNLGTISNDLNITGEGNVVIDAQNNNRILYVGIDANVVIKNVVMVNGYATDGSGALLGNANKLTLINCTLANSSAATNNGGAIYNVGKLTIINSTIANNTAKEGGAIFTNDALAAGASIVIDNSVFENNVAAGDENMGGGAIFAQQITGLTITDSTFKNNKAQGTSCGGAIFISHSEADIQITGSEFIANHANGKEDIGGGAIYMVGTSNYERKGTLTISNTLFEDNTADSNGGAIYVRATTLKISNSVLVNNTDANGLAIYGYKTEQISPSITANDNWWGTNDDPKDLVGGNNNYKPTISSWAKVTVSNDTAIAEGNAVNITVAFDKDIKISRPVSLRIDSEIINGVLENGEFVKTYTVPAGLKIISADVDDASVILYVVTTPTSMEIADVNAEKGDYVNFNIEVKTNDDSVVTAGNVEIYFDNDLVATIPVVNGVANKDVFIGKEAGEYNITAKFIDSTTEFGNSQANATLKVTGTNNIVTPESFNKFFDENGVLKSEVLLDELIFKGNFENIGVNVITLNKTVKITGVNAKLTDIALKITGENVEIDNIEIALTKNFSETDGAAVYIGGNNTVVKNSVITYNAPNDVQSYAISVDIADGVKIIGNEITYSAQSEGNVKTIVVNALKANGFVFEDNTIDATLPSVPINYYVKPYVYPSKALSIDKSNAVSVKNNTISIEYSNFDGIADTIYGVHITETNNVNVSENDIELNAHEYGYGLVMDGKDIKVSNNDITVTSEGTYANGININKDSTAVIDENNVDVSSEEVTYGVWIDDWFSKNPSEVNITNNNISADSCTVYAVSIQGNKSTISNNNIEATGNFTMGILAHDTDVVISNNKIVSNGTNEGVPLSAQSSVPQETTGICVSQGNAVITNNNVSSTGNSSVDAIGTTGTIKDNKLVAGNKTGDAAITAKNSTSMTFDNNKTSVIKENGSNTNGSNTTPVKPTPKVYKLTAKNLNMYYMDGSKFKVLLTLNGKAAAGKVVVIKLAGKTYKVKTNKKGYAVLKISNVPKKYKVVVTFGKLKIQKTVAVKQVLTSKNVKVKKSAKKLVLQATLKKGKKPIKGKKITFKFKGKTYKAKTNKKGVAKVVIKKNVIKKLKAGKKYAVKITYLKDTIKKTVAVRK